MQTYCAFLVSLIPLKKTFDTVFSHAQNEEEIVAGLSNLTSDEALAKAIIEELHQFKDS